MVSNNFGLKLLELAGTQVSFGDLVTKFVAASDAGEMSTFSSWGTISFVYFSFKRGAVMYVSFR